MWLNVLQIRGMHTLIRDKDISKHDFVFYSDRLIRLVLFHSGINFSWILLTACFQCFCHEKFPIIWLPGCRAWSWPLTIHWEASDNSNRCIFLQFTCCTNCSLCLQNAESVDDHFILMCCAGRSLSSLLSYHTILLPSCYYPYEAPTYVWCRVSSIHHLPLQATS